MVTAAQSPTPPRSAPLGRLRTPKRPWWILVVIAALALAAGAVVMVRRKQAATAAPRYLTATITRGDLSETVRATGTVRPVLEVQVGAQISGRVTNVAVDFNSHVHQGDLLAELDPTPYQAQAAQVRAQLASARAQLLQRRADLTLAERNLARATTLRTNNLNAQADVDSAVATRDSARAAVGVAQAQIEQSSAAVDVARTNLTYTRILAPIDGIVASRAVDPGQSVAASLQIATLFIIDNDLTHMRVIANVDEANIGKLTEGMDATARVDAFPRDSFRGTVRELRITPTTTNGVVTYQAVIDVDNPQSRLRPGMTATVTAISARHANVLRVPNAALRYRPSNVAATPDAGVAGGPSGDRANGGSGPSSDRTGAPGDGGVAMPAADGADGGVANGGRHGGGRRGGGGGGGGRGGGGGAGGGGGGRGASDRGTVYLLQGNSAVRVSVAVGLTDGVVTEVTAPELTEGARVVVDETDSVNAAPAAPAAGGRGPRAPRMF